VIGAEASGGELRAVQAGHALVRALLARGLPAAGGAGGPAGRGPSRLAGTRHRPVSRSRRSRSGPRSSRSCLMPGIIRCPESTAIQAGNPDHPGPRRGTRRFCLQRGSRGSDSGSAWSTLAQRRRRPAQRSLCATGAEAVVAADGCLPAGRNSLRRQATCGMAARRGSRHEC
jgi:hypothetical protein